MSEKTPGQVAVDAAIKERWVIHPKAADIAAEAVIAHVRAQIEAEARAAAVEEALRIVHSYNLHFDVVDKAIRAIASAPPGYVCVPVEPTEEMIIAGAEASLLGRPSPDDGSYVDSIYTTMLAAARQK